MEVINLALKGKPKDTLKWLKDHKIIIESRYDEKFIYEVTLGQIKIRTLGFSVFRLST